MYDSHWLDRWEHFHSLVQPLPSLAKSTESTGSPVAYGVSGMPWGYPHSWLDGLFHGKSHLEMDDNWGYPYFRKPPYISLFEQCFVPTAMVRRTPTDILWHDEKTPSRWWRKTYESPVDESSRLVKSLNVGPWFLLGQKYQKLASCSSKSSCWISNLGQHKSLLRHLP